VNNDLPKSILEIPAENQNTEFKRLGGDGKVDVAKIIITIVAMANIDGGVVILGVDDPEKTRLKGLDRIFGIEENPELYDAIGRGIERIIPPLTGIWPGDILEVREIKKRIALVFVPKAIESFHSINNHVFVRQEKGNRQLTAHEVVKFAYAKGFEKADKGLVEVDFSLLKTAYF
jgi:predicted HTH transcriptional regulator